MLGFDREALLCYGLWAAPGIRLRKVSRPCGIIDFRASLLLR